MPEIGEIARTVHFLRKNLLSRRISQVLTTEDTIVYNAKAPADTTHTSFAAALTGKTVLDARQQGKYFWLVLDSAPHPLFHFGMTGWIKFKGQDTFYKSEGNEGEEGDAVGEEKERNGKADEEWPPKFWKFVLKMEGEPACEAAFVDKRRLARIRLVDASADDMRNTTPLKENGPDPVIDKDTLTAEWLKQKMRSKKVPVKALLLDQANISGVGNWVGDEVLYHAKIHPEQYSNTLSDAQLEQLHKSLMYVCGLACEVLSDSSKFPEEWLFKHRWNKGKKGEKMNVLPSGEKIEHITVGGRTSAIVPSVQKKTGPVAGDVDGKAGEDGAKKTAKKGKRKVKEESDLEADEEEEEEAVEKPAKKAKSQPAKKAAEAKKEKKSAKRKVKAESSIEDDEEEEPEEETQKPKKKAKQPSKAIKPAEAKKAANGIHKKEKKPSTAKQAVETNGGATGTRKSARLGRS